MNPVFLKQNYFETCKDELKRLYREPLLFASIIFAVYFLFVFIVFPLINVIGASLTYNEIFSLKHYIDFWKTSYLITPLINSIKLGVLVGLFGTATGFFLAYAITKKCVPFGNFFSTVSTIPIVAPPFIVALSSILIFGNNGYLTRLLFGGNAPFSIYGMWGLVVVETLAYFPTALLVLIGTLKAISASFEEASMNLGASRRSTFWRVTLPLAIPGIASSFLLIFIESLADFGNPLILSGRFPVLSVQAYLHITALYDVGGGAVLAVMLLLPSMLAYGIQKKLSNRRSYITISGKSGHVSEIRRSIFSKTIWTILVASICALVLLFYASIFIGAFVRLWGIDSTFTFDNFAKVVSMGKNYIWDSVLLALISMPITGLVGLYLAYLTTRKKFPGRKIMSFVSLLAFAVPGTIVGIGYVLAFNQPNWFFPFTLQGTAYIILFLFCFRNMPVGMQAGIAGLSQIDVNIEEASRTLGAGSFTTFSKIVLPLLAPAFFSGLITSFVRAMTQISAIIFVVSGKWNLLTVFILGLVENGEISMAAATSILLVGIILIALGILKYVIHRISTKQLTKAAW